jgi:FRG domain
MDCDLWSQFKNSIDELTNSSGFSFYRRVFRGQADSDWGIISSFDRFCLPEHAIDRKYYEGKIRFFSYLLIQYGENITQLSVEDQASIAQHYGMPTKLIDWSASPYVAAFMAAYSALDEGRIELGKRISVFCLDLDLLEAAHSGLRNHFRVVKPKTQKNDRVWRQSGVFIEPIGDYSDLCEAINFLDESSPLKKFTIPTRLCCDILNDLINMGLTPSSIYPDRDGAAKYVRLRLALDKYSSHQL